MSAKKGKKDYNFHSRKNFRYKNDAILTYYWEKAGVSYIRKDGKFTEVITSD